MERNTVIEHPAADRRERVRKEIKQLISDRTQMLAVYCNLVEIIKEPLDPEAHHEEMHLLQEFCQMLIDYIAKGHFELYQRIVDGEERRKDVLKLANQSYARISQTTQHAVDFNDYYDYGNPNSMKELERLPQRLSALGEELATRIELEDQLINALLPVRQSDFNMMV